MKLCRRCIEAIRYHGEPIYNYTTLIAEVPFLTSEEAQVMDIRCEWCDEIDELFDCLLD